MNAPDEALNADDLSSYLVSAKAGDFIFREHDAGADMFIIRSGRVELLKEYAGQERQIALLEVGDFFGEMSLLEDQPRELSARAVGGVELLRIDASTFDRIVQEAPEIPVRMLRKLARRLRDYQDHDSRAAAIAMGPLAPKPAVPQPAPAAAPATKAARLVDPVSHKAFALDGLTEATIGRIDRATGFTPDIDVTPLDAERTLSRRHAKIVSRDGEFFVREEMGTRNGTFVNGVRVQTGVDVKLSNGDRLRFGLVETVFEIR
jgi:CRP-like cAMP-binding protein